MKLKSLLMVFIMCLLIVQAALAQSAWTNQGMNDPNIFGYQSYNFSGVLDDDDTLYTNPIFPLYKSDTTFTFKFFADQANDSIRLTIYKQFRGAYGWVTNHIVGIDSLTSEVRWNDTIKSHSIPYRYAIVGTSISGGDNNGQNTSFWGKVIFIRKE